MYRGKSLRFIDIQRGTLYGKSLEKQRRFYRWTNNGSTMLCLGPVGRSRGIQWFYYSPDDPPINETWSVEADVMRDTYVEYGNGRWSGQVFRYRSGGATVYVCSFYVLDIWPVSPLKYSRHEKSSIYGRRAVIILIKC